jgi:hypothetical protein
MIYAFVFEDTSFKFDAKYPDIVFTKSSRCHAAFNLVYVCRQLYTETAILPYATGFFDFSSVQGQGLYSVHHFFWPD